MLAALLITCAVSTQTPTTEAPQLPPWPTGLAPVVEHDDGTTCFDPLRSKATAKRLEACAAIPGRCQARMDALLGACDARVDRAIKREQVDALAARAKDQTAAAAKWELWEVVLAVIVTGLAAGGVGLGAGVLIGGTR